jgi:hypothetical protein
VVSENGALLDKLPGGPERQAERLRREGIEVEKRRARWFVTNMEAVGVSP